MKNIKLFQRILDIYKTQKPCNIHRKIRLYPELVQEITDNTDFLTAEGCGLAIRIYCYLNGITEYPKCKLCGTPIQNRQFVNIKQGFANYCSHYCRHHQDDTKNKCAQTKLERYGDPGFNNKEKSRKTRLDRYNGHFLEPGHAENVMKTCLEKYGDAHFNNHEKAEQTNIKKYGVKTPLQVNNFRRNPDKTEYSYFNILCQNRYDYPNFSFNEYKKRESCRDQLEFVCKKCGKLFLSVHDNGKHKRCPVCYPNDSSISDLNRRIYQILNNAHIEFIPEFFIRENDMIRFFDILFDNNVFLEINGVFWHANPNIYDNNQILNIPGKGQIKVSDIHVRDYEKKCLAERHGFTVKYLWESDMKAMSDNEILMWLRNICNI